MGRLLASLVLAALLATALAAFRDTVADQTDRRLDAMFERLRTTDDEREGARLTDEIWTIWRATDDAAAQAEMAEGMAAMSNQRYDLALAAFDDLVRTAPDFAEGWNARATLHYLMDDYTASVRDIRRTLALEPRHFGAMSGLGLIYMRLGEDESALKAFEKALEINPHLPGTREHVEELRRKIGDRAI